MVAFRRHFCFCIPVRFGVFVTSLLLCLLAGIASAAAFWLTWAINHDPQSLVDQHITMSFSKGWRIGIIVFGSVFALVSIISLFGFIGSVFKNRRMVKAYAALAWVVFLVMLVASVAFMYAIYSPHGLAKCQDLVHNTTVTCPQLTTGRKVGDTVVVVLALFIQLYICAIIGRYVEQLENEQVFTNEFGLNKTSSYYAHQPLSSNYNEGLLPQQGSYPYTDQSHAFGHASR